MLTFFFNTFEMRVVAKILASRHTSAEVGLRKQYRHIYIISIICGFLSPNRLFDSFSPIPDFLKCTGKKLHFGIGICIKENMKSARGQMIHAGSCAH